MKTETDYTKLQADLAAVEVKNSTFETFYLSDTNVDRENVLVDGRTEQSADFWDCMWHAAASAAGQRAEEYGKNINALLGYAVY